MRAIKKVAAAIALALGFPVVASAAILGGSQYAIQYDYRDFFAATDNKTFRVVLLGNPYPNMEMSEVARRLLPVMQLNKPPPNLTFTYDVPVEPPHPDYRLVLVFNPANDLGSGAVCNGASRFQPAVPGKIYVYAVYCRNDLALSEVTGRVASSAPDDQGMNDLMKDLFNVVFDRSPYLMRQHGHGSFGG
ncbi:hypothetical protein SAMN02745126_01340 [Enhydrobacter aerosaccus]|uniref:DUF4136 domain-containing protein n=1 Tax=Enhydrobacter aerosaccus TaxID=225324 RepID=A0A1T4L4C9_9HYPH|nr:hypothetical protein [Enhydrobacter aerosaccus]SJZ49582.1 hypothetical protein SAMN02745126_01340 [Enhydrobacter aerosaccus]